MSKYDDAKFGDVWRDTSDGETVMLVNVTGNRAPNGDYLDWAVIQLAGIRRDPPISECIHRIINSVCERLDG